MQSRPAVTLTFAQSLDGRIATRSGDSRWISGDESLNLAHEIRRDNDAILVGVGTVLRDDPELTCRLPDCDSPLRVILDSELRTPPRSRIACTARDIPTVLFTAAERRSAACDPSRFSPSRGALIDCGIEVVDVQRSGDDRLSLPAVLDELSWRGVSSLMVEGGAAVLTSFIRARLVDRIVVVAAPVIIGAGTETVGDLGVDALAQAWRGRTVSVRRLGQDVVWEVRFDSEVPV